MKRPFCYCISHCFLFVYLQGDISDVDFILWLCEHICKHTTGELLQLVFKTVAYFSKSQIPQKKKHRDKRNYPMALLNWIKVECLKAQSNNHYWACMSAHCICKFFTSVMDHNPHNKNGRWNPNYLVRQWYTYKSSFNFSQLYKWILDVLLNFQSVLLLYILIL